MSDQKSAVFFGASRGIGRTLALEAASRGVNASVFARRFDRADDELKRSANLIAMDVTSGNLIDILSPDAVWNQRYVFWTVGGYHRARLSDMDASLDGMIDTHLRALIKVICEIHRGKRTMREHLGLGVESHLPYTLVVIGSIISYKLRRHETIYAMAKAGQSAFLRTYAPELAEDFPGSKILLVNCARLGTEPGEQKLDAGGRRIDPGYVAKFIWDMLQEDSKIMNRPFTQVNVDRNSDGPILSYGPQLPEIP